LTVPVAAAIGGLSGKLASAGDGGVTAVAGAAVAVIVVVYAYSRRAPVTARNVNETPAAEVAGAPDLLVAA
jgi:hypothetical protein